MCAQPSTTAAHLNAHTSRYIYILCIGIVTSGYWLYNITYLLDQHAYINIYNVYNSHNIGW